MSLHAEWLADPAPGGNPGAPIYQPPAGGAGAAAPGAAATSSSTLWIVGGMAVAALGAAWLLARSAR